jgi:signal transduction histidine kinase/ligand-binding sensor domain-containing protein
MRRLFTLVLLLACAMPAAALNPAIALADLNHTAWTDKDGAPSGIYDMAQTRDGWLWLATQGGLYRFDGVRFERYPSMKKHVFTLHASLNGDLVIGYMAGGLSVLHPDGQREDYDDKAQTMGGGIGSMVQDADGAVWLVTSVGLFRYQHRTLQKIDGSRAWVGMFHGLLRDQYDRIWAANEDGVFVIDRAAGKLNLVEKTPSGRLMQSPDGQIWTSGHTDELRAVAMPATAAQLPRRPQSNQARATRSGQFDRDGNLWQAHCPVGVCRMPASQLQASRVIAMRGAGVESISQAGQLSSLATQAVMEDREGNIWVLTNAGIDRFRENKLIPARLPGAIGRYSMALDRDKQLWVADMGSGQLWRVPADGPPVADTRPFVQVLANDRNGALLLAGKREIERLDHGISRTIPMPLVNGKAHDLNLLGMLDDGKVLWITSFETGLMGLVDGQWQPRAHFHLPPKIMTSAAGGIGQLWLGHTNGKLDLYDNDKLSEYDISSIGLETGFFAGPQVVVAGEHGIAVQRGQRFELLGPPDVAPLCDISGMTVTADGDRWFNGSQGVVRIRRDDWEAALRAPTAPLKYDLLDAQEGYLGRANTTLRMPTLVNAGNGRLWFYGSAGVVRLETAQLRTNSVRPDVQVLKLDTGAASYGGGSAVRLPSGSRSFTIQYTSPGLRKPEGMRFQYLMDGLDTQWVDAGGRRAAYYTNIGPGHYTFRVRAVNEDGVAGASVASLPIEVAPTLVQSWWFRLLCAALLLAAGFSLYRYRIRSVIAQAARQADARADERDRIARTLHDTFLQSVYALMLQVHTVLVKLPKDSEEQRKLQTVLDLANQTIEEGRAQVQQLRTGYDPEQVLRQIGESMAMIHAGTASEMRVQGQRRKLTAAAQEELCGIGQEALHNAFRHAAGSLVTIDLAYAADGLTLRIADNGKGICNDAIQPAAQGHWGLVGMRERASRIGGQISIAGGAGVGTVVELRIPARRAYAPPD